MLEEYYHPQLEFSENIVSNNRKQMQLDVFVPSLKLAFEYHGKQHYEDHPIFGSFSDQQVRDRVFMHKNTYTHI